jgi:hypothetical protein
MFDDIIGETKYDFVKSCLNCMFYYEGVTLPGNLKTVEFCSEKGMTFNGEITANCNSWKFKDKFNV